MQRTIQKLIPWLWPLAFVPLTRADEKKDDANVQTLDSVVILAGQLPTGDQPEAVLRSSQVALTPGANADINRALQTFPGVQLVDDGNALFVRGGASTETITRVNGLYFPSSLNLNSPTGTFTNTLNAYEARKIDFAVGGFDARFGNALSGVVDLDTVGAPRSTVTTLGASIGSVSVGSNVALADRFGVRFSVSRNNIGPFFDLNGSPRDFTERPNGREASFTIASPYRKSGEVKLFYVQRRQEFAVVDPQPGVQSVYGQSDLMRFAALSWKDVFGNWSAQASIGGGDTQRIGQSAYFQQIMRFEHRQFSATASYKGNDWISFATGVDGLRGDSRIHDWISPTLGYATGAFDADITERRWGAFVKTDVALAPHLRSVISLRTDESRLTGRLTYDPRFSLAWEPKRRVTLSAAAGIYHQIPTPYEFLDFYNGGKLIELPASIDRQGILGLQLGRGAKLLRVEAYAKDYGDLVSLSRSYAPVAGGHGRAEGFDFFAKYPLPWKINGRLTYGYVDTKRTDPNTGIVAPAAFDVHHSLSLILERTIAGWNVGASLRGASGKPITPIIGGVPDAAGNYSPIYGAPRSERLPPVRKVDLMISRYFKTSERTSLAVYVTVNNALNRSNVYTYGYSNDYTQRFPVKGIYNRSIYFGATLQFY